MIETVGIRDAALYNRRMRIFLEEVGVYPVSCEKLSAGRDDRTWLDGVLAGGGKIVQLRDKESDDNVLLEKARYFKTRCREAGALFMVNDRLDIALLSDADGMHVGQNDLHPAEIRTLAPDIIIGLSCNSLEHVQQLGSLVKSSKCSASYFNVGPIYATGTKEGLHTFLGPEVISNYTSHCDLPFTVMGGIKFNHVQELISSGAKRLAVVTAISQAQDIAQETAKWQTEIMKHRQLMDNG